MTSKSSKKSKKTKKIINTCPNNDVISMLNNFLENFSTEELNKEKVSREYDEFKNKFNNCLSLEELSDRSITWKFAWYSNTSHPVLYPNEFYNDNCIAVVVYKRKDKKYFYEMRLFIHNQFYFNSKESGQRLLKCSNWRATFNINSIPKK